jgi:S1-C subfamily serine protease
VLGCLGALLLLATEALPAPAQTGDRWGWLGVRIRDLSEQEMEEISRQHGIAEGFGALVVEILKDAPAEGSGLAQGDLVVAVAGRLVVDTRALQRLVGRTRVGEPIALTVLRRGEGRRAVTVRVGPMPQPVVAERVAAEFGFLVRDQEQLPVPGEWRPAGVPTVVAVLSGGRAERAGLRAGDVLLEVNGRAVLTAEALREALAGASLEHPLALQVRRGGEGLAVVVPPPPGAASRPAPSSP